MAIYAYSYLDNRKKKRGRIEASSEREAKAKLLEGGLLITSIGPDRGTIGRHSLRGQALIDFTVQLGGLIRAGLPIFESLSCLEEQARSERYHQVLAALCEAIERGASLSEAMEQHPASFSPLYCAMVAAGENSGTLEEVIERLADLLIRQQAMKRKLITTLTYPAVIAVFCLVVVFLLLTFAIPSIETLFEGHQTSAITSVVLAISHLLSRYWWFYLPSLGIGAYFLVRLSRTERTLHFYLKVPLLRQLIVQRELSRFSRTLATLLRGGLNTIDSIRLSQRSLSHPAFIALITRIERGIVQGNSLSSEFRRSHLVPPLVSRMLLVGEESGDLSGMCERIAESYERALEKTLTRLATLAQPLILLLMGGIVGAIMLAVLLPLTDVSAIM